MRVIIEKMVALIFLLFSGKFHAISYHFGSSTGRNDSDIVHTSRGDSPLSKNFK